MDNGARFGHLHHPQILSLVNVIIKIAPSATLTGSSIFSAYHGKEFLFTTVKESEIEGIATAKLGARLALEKQGRTPTRFRIERKGGVLEDERKW